MAAASDLVQYALRQWFDRHPPRVQAGYLARQLEFDWQSVFAACCALHVAGYLTRRTDAAGKVWWSARRKREHRLTRKDHIVAALERDIELSTARLCATWGEQNTRRGLPVLCYYQRSGLIEAAVSRPGEAAVWRLKV